MADARVIDTNVGIAANGQANVSASCQLRCVELLEETVARGGLVMDTADAIFDEYRRHLRFAGEPGVGDVFMKWVHDNRFNLDVNFTVDLVQLSDQEGDFDQFPDSADLRTFDRADRKFVAASMAHVDVAPIYVAGDRGWARHRAALASHGVPVRLLHC